MNRLQLKVLGCKGTVLGGSGYVGLVVGKLIARTRVQYGDEPVFNERFIFQLRENAEVIQIQVFDRNSICLYYANFSITSLTPGEREEKWISLQGQGDHNDQASIGCVMVLEEAKPTANEAAGAAATQQPHGPGGGTKLMPATVVAPSQIHAPGPPAAPQGPPVTASESSDDDKGKQTLHRRHPRSNRRHTNSGTRRKKKGDREDDGHRKKDRKHSRDRKEERHKKHSSSSHGPPAAAQQESSSRDQHSIPSGAGSNTAVGRNNLPPNSSSSDQNHQRPLSDSPNTTSSSNPAVASLIVTVIGARNIAPQKTGTDCNPYVKVIVLDHVKSKTAKAHSTTVKYNNTHPIWNEEFCFIVNKKDQVLHLKVYDNYDNKHTVGSYALDLRSLPNTQRQEHWINLEQRGVPTSSLLGFATIMHRKGARVNVDRVASGDPQPVIVYSTSMGKTRKESEDSVKLVQFLDSLKLRYVEVDTAMGNGPNRHIIENKSGCTTMPQAFVGDAFIGTFDVLEGMHEMGLLVAKLMESGYGKPATSTPNHNLNTNPGIHNYSPMMNHLTPHLPQFNNHSNNASPMFGTHNDMSQLVVGDDGMLHGQARPMMMAVNGPAGHMQQPNNSSPSHRHSTPPNNPHHHHPSSPAQYPLHSGNRSNRPLRPKRKASPTSKSRPTQPPSARTDEYTTSSNRSTPPHLRPISPSHRASHTGDPSSAPSLSKVNGARHRATAPGSTPSVRGGHDNEDTSSVSSNHFDSKPDYSRRSPRSPRVSASQAHNINSHGPGGSMQQPQPPTTAPMYFMPPFPHFAMPYPFPMSPTTAAAMMFASPQNMRHQTPPHQPVQVPGGELSNIINAYVSTSADAFGAHPQVHASAPSPMLAPKPQQHHQNNPNPPQQQPPKVEVPDAVANACAQVAGAAVLAAQEIAEAVGGTLPSNNNNMSHNNTAAPGPARGGTTTTQQQQQQQQQQAPANMTTGGPNAIDVSSLPNMSNIGPIPPNNITFHQAPAAAPGMAGYTPPPRSMSPSGSSGGNNTPQVVVVPFNSNAPPPPPQPPTAIPAVIAAGSPHVARSPSQSQLGMTAPMPPPPPPHLHPPHPSMGHGPVMVNHIPPPPGPPQPPPIIVPGPPPPPPGHPQQPPFAGPPPHGPPPPPPTAPGMHRTGHSPLHYYNYGADMSDPSDMSDGHPDLSDQSPRSGGFDGEVQEVIQRLHAIAERERQIDDEIALAQHRQRELLGQSSNRWQPPKPWMAHK